MVATPSSFPFPKTGDSLIDVITNGFKWNLDSTRTINWSISNGFNGENWLNPSQFATELQYAFTGFSYYANVTFNYLGYFQSPTIAGGAGSQINVSMDRVDQFFTNTNQLAKGYFPTTLSNTLYSTQAGDVYLNIKSAANNLLSYAPGSTGFALILHELGHALGLKHTHDDGGTGRPKFSDLGLSGLDRDWFSIMSYNDDYSWNQLAWDAMTPMALDALGLMYLYGPNMNTNAGTNSFLVERLNSYVTVWDAGGEDTINCSATPFPVLVDVELATESTMGIKIGLAKPANELTLPSPSTLYWLLGDYENIQGSTYSDTLYGNSENNAIYGNGGNDTINGRGGLNTAGFRGLGGNYTYNLAGSNVTVTDKTGLDGTDTLTNIQRLDFSNGTMALDVNVWETAGEAYRLYRAAFARTPDNGGLKYWIGQMDNGQTNIQVAHNFIVSAEFQSLYGSNPTHSQLVTAMYQNVLNRTPDQGGFDYWKGLLDNNQITSEQLLINFSESNENVAAVGVAIHNGIWLA